MKYRTVWSFYISFTILFTAQLVPQEIGSPFIRAYTPKEYNNTGQVWAAFQRDNGLMYFGMTGGGGIVEYDGKSWRVIPVPTTVFSFAQDTKKRVYAGAINDFGYLAPDAHGQNIFVSLRRLIPQQDLKFKAVWITVADGDDIYFMSVDAIFKYSQTPQERITTYFPGPEGKFTALFRHAGAVYTMQSGRGMLRIGSDSLELFSDFYKDKPARNGLSLSADSLIVPTRKDGIFLHRRNERIPAPFAFNDTSFLNDNNVYSSALLPGNSLAFGSNNKGVRIVSPQGRLLQRWDEMSHVPINSVYQIYPSRDGNLWFSTENGIIRTEMTPAWSYWDKNSGLEGVVMDILRFDGRLYVATLRGVYFINSHHQPERVSGIPAGQSWRFFIYTTPEKKRILLAGTAEGVFRIDGRTASQIRKGAHTTAFCVLRSDPQRVLINTNPSLIVMKYEKGQWKEEGAVEGVNDNLQETVQDENGDLWIATYAQGIIRVTLDEKELLKPKKIRYYTEKDGLPSLRVAVPYMLNDVIVYGTEQGLYTYNTTADRFEPYTALDPFLPNGRHDILEIERMDDGTIVVLPSTNKVLRAGYLAPVSGGSFSWNEKAFLNLPQMEFESVFQDSNGVVWLGGSEGLFRYNAAADRMNDDAEFRTLIRKVSLKGDSTLSFGESLTAGTIEYGSNDVRFETAAPFFDDESKTTFSHRLEGYEREWSPWSSDASAVYTNLDEGEYTFRAIAKNMYGTVSISAAYSFRILPPLYRTWWAYGSYGMFLAISILLFDRWNKRRLRNLYAKEHALEQQRQQNFSRMLMDRQEQERKRIAGELHDSLGQELLILKHRIQLHLRNDALPPELKGTFEEYSASTSDILNQLRIISHNLRPPELDKLGLTESIKAVLRRVRNAKQMEIVGEIDEIDGFFAKNEEINLIRILQESLNNIIKHSDAARTVIIVSLREDHLFVTVSDNGKGISGPTNGSAGLGMHDIEDRVRLLGGTMTVESSAGTGTTLIFRFQKKG
jgi:signal transduction histidine kinase